jgi:hypothetical protein
MRPTTTIVIAAATSLILGCGASIPPPNDEWAAAQADVGRAQAGGADQVPDARLHLQLALEDLWKSKQLINDDNRRAASLIAVARTEAQLALSIAKAAAAVDDQQKAEDELRKARSD